MVVNAWMRDGNSGKKIKFNPLGTRIMIIYLLNTNRRHPEE
jgi:hypothetical protein